MAAAGRCVLSRNETAYHECIRPYGECQTGRRLVTVTMLRRAPGSKANRKSLLGQRVWFFQQIDQSPNELRRRRAVNNTVIA